MDLFVVTKNGIQMTEIRGIFSSLSDAHSFGDSQIRQEPDDYHEFAITQHALNAGERGRELGRFSRVGEAVTYKES